MVSQDDWNEISQVGMPPYGRMVNAFPVQFTETGVGTLRVYNDGKGGSVFEGNNAVTHWRYLPGPPKGLLIDKFGNVKKSNSI